METRKAQTTKINGGAEYAKVADRLKLFREDCPNGSIKTNHEFLPDGKIVFTAYVLKNKADNTSGDSTGSAFGELKTQKSFEKLETIAIGRALATLGYLASGEIASSEEMEEFYSFRSDKITGEYQEKLMNVSSVDELKTVWSALPAEAKKALQGLKDTLKGELEVAHASK